MTSQLWWYVARAAGIVSWALVAISVCWGLLLAGRPSRPARPVPERVPADLSARARPAVAELESAGR